MYAEVFGTFLYERWEFVWVGNILGRIYIQEVRCCGSITIYNNCVVVALVLEGVPAKSEKSQGNCVLADILKGCMECGRYSSRKRVFSLAAEWWMERNFGSPRGNIAPVFVHSRLTLDVRS